MNSVKITKNIFQRWSRIWPLLFGFCAISTRLPEERMGVTKKSVPQRIPVKITKKKTGEELICKNFGVNGILETITDLFSCVLFFLFPPFAGQPCSSPLLGTFPLNSALFCRTKGTVHSSERGSFIGENQKGTAGRGRQKKCHDNLRHVTTICDILWQFPSLYSIDINVIKRHKLSYNLS